MPGYRALLGIACPYYCPITASASILMSMSG